VDEARRSYYTNLFPLNPSGELQLHLGYHPLPHPNPNPAHQRAPLNPHNNRHHPIRPHQSRFTAGQASRERRERDRWGVLDAEARRCRGGSGAV